MGWVGTWHPIHFCMTLWPFRRTKKKDIYVIYTAKRPVPLEHYLYASASRDMYKIVNAGGEFISQGFVRSQLGSRKLSYSKHIIGIRMLGKP
jgi:superfamily II RNA helicase